MPKQSQRSRAVSTRTTCKGPKDPPAATLAVTSGQPRQPPTLSGKRPMTQFTTNRSYAPTTVSAPISLKVEGCAMTPTLPSQRSLRRDQECAWASDHVKGTQGAASCAGQQAKQAWGNEFARTCFQDTIRPHLYGISSDPAARPSEESPSEGV